MNGSSGLNRVFFYASARLASSFTRHGELWLLRHWVCDTSALRRFSRPNSPREYNHSSLRVSRLWFAFGELRASDFCCSLELLAFGARLAFAIASLLASRARLAFAIASLSPLACLWRVTFGTFWNCSPLASFYSLWRVILLNFSLIFPLWFMSWDQYMHNWVK